MRTRLLQAEKELQLDTTLQKKHAELVTLVSAATQQYRGMTYTTPRRLVAALKSQQAAWVKYRDEECELLGSLTGAADQWQSAHANRCGINLTDLRLKSIQSAQACILRIPEADRLGKQSECLQQLAPLVNH